MHTRELSCVFVPNDLFTDSTSTTQLTSGDVLVAVARESLVEALAWTLALAYTEIDHAEQAKGDSEEWQNLCKRIRQCRLSSVIERRTLVASRL